MKIIKKIIAYALVCTALLLSGCASGDPQKDYAYGWIGGDFITRQNGSWVQWDSEYAVSVAHLGEVEGQSEYISKDMDVQFLKRSSINVPIWRDYKIGDKVMMVGWPKTQDEEKRVPGVILEEMGQRSETSYVANYVLIQGMIEKGMSGGPVMNERGEVIGINLGYCLRTIKVAGKETNCSFMVPYLEIKNAWAKFQTQKNLGVPKDIKLKKLIFSDAAK